MSAALIRPRPSSPERRTAAAVERPSDGAALRDEVVQDEAPRDEAAQDETIRPENRRGPFRPSRLIPTRSRLQGRSIAHLFQAADVLALSGVGAFTALGHDDVRLTLALAGGLAALVNLSMFKLYAFGQREGLGLHLGRLAIALAIASAVAFASLALLTPLPGLLNALASWIPSTFAALLVLHTLWWVCVRRWRISGRLTPNIVVVGATGAAERLIAATLTSREANILGVFDDRGARSPEALHGVPILGDTQALIGHRIMPYVDRIVITVPSRARARVRDLIGRLRVLPNEITLLLDDGDVEHEAAAISRIADVPLAHISGPPTEHGRAMVKRAQDLVIGLIALAVATPVMAIIAIAIRLDSPGPILFRQRRHGFNNEEIVVWKFRSMRIEATDHHATQQVRPDDERVTRIGRFIRQASLDELPQILNVLMGEMSLVGPRPHAVGMMTGDVESARLVAEYAHRHQMKPGMTGWAAIHGSRGPVDTPELVRRRVALDVDYIERQSFWLDLYIIAMTIPCLVGDAKAVR
jgi:Undecaprenyl-phosphate glucose phosphotransferase